jgi:hypothetical protein
VQEKGKDVKPGPQALAQTNDEDELQGGHGRSNGESSGPKITGLPNDLKDIMDMTTDHAPMGGAAHLNGHLAHHERIPVPDVQGDVSMGEAPQNGADEGHSLSTITVDPVQEQLEMEMSGMQHHVYHGNQQNGT